MVRHSRKQKGEINFMYLLTGGAPWQSLDEVETG
jgi:hypothetical protein